MITKLRIISILLVFISLLKIGCAQNFWEKVEFPNCGLVGDVFVDKSDNVYVLTATGLYLRKLGNQEFMLFSENFFLKLFTFKDINYAAGQNVYSLNLKDNAIDSISVFPWGVQDILCSKDETIYFATPGFILKSYDLIQPWDTVCNNDSLGVVYSLAEDDDGILYSGGVSFFSDGGGIFRSINNGITWNQFGLINHSVATVTVNKDNELFAGSIIDSYGLGGMFKYNKVDNRWDTLFYNFTSVSSIVIDTSNIIYYATDNNNGGDTVWVKCSYDNGLTWNNIASGLSYPTNKLYLGHDGYLYAISQASIGDSIVGGLYRSSEPIYVGISNDLKYTSGISVYPNPFNTNITVVNNQTGSLSLFDTSGKLMYAAKLSTNDNTTINLSKLEKGIYILQFIGDTNITYSQILIKQ